MKKITSLLLSVVIFISMMTVAVPIQASDWRETVCFDPVKSKENRAECQAYLQELEDNAAKIKEELEQYKIDAAEIRKNVLSEARKIKELEKDIEQQEAHIDNLETGIRQLQVSVKELETSILMRENEIKAKEAIIIERMKKDQSDIYFGNEIDFIMGSEDFATLISTISILKDILDYENQQIQEIEKIIEVQNEEKEVMKVQQETLKVTKENAELKRNQAKKTKEKIEVVVAEFKKQELELLAAETQAASNVNQIQEQMQAISKSLEAVVPSSGGFARPISGGYISARVWNYPASFGGGMHLGYDYAAPVGTPIYAAGNGVVLSANDGCPTFGGLGNWCGTPGQLGGGNQVNLVVNIDGSIYQVSYFHMQQGSPIATGSIVKKGQVIGRLGSSGNSTGPHVHAEIIYLGNGNISDYVTHWNGDFTRGLGMSSAAACEYNGHQAPCRLNPGEVWN